MADRRNHRTMHSASTTFGAKITRTHQQHRHENTRTTPRASPEITQTTGYSENRPIPTQAIRLLSFAKNSRLTAAEIRREFDHTRTQTHQRTRSPATDHRRYSRISGRAAIRRRRGEKKKLKMAKRDACYAHNETRWRLRVRVRETHAALCSTATAFATHFSPEQTRFSSIAVCPTYALLPTFLPEIYRRFRTLRFRSFFFPAFSRRGFFFFVFQFSKPMDGGRALFFLTRN